MRRNISREWWSLLDPDDLTERKSYRTLDQALKANKCVKGGSFVTCTSKGILTRRSIKAAAGIYIIVDNGHMAGILTRRKDRDKANYYKEVYNHGQLR